MLHLVIFCRAEQIGVALADRTNHVGYNFPSNYAHTLCRTNDGKDNRDRFEITTNNYLHTHTSKQSFKSEDLQARKQKEQKSRFSITRILIQSYLHKGHMAIIQSRG